MISKAFFFSLLIALVTLPAFAADDAAGATGPVLPKQFAGWRMNAPERVSKDPAAADPVNAALLKEYGFAQFEQATYVRDDNRKLNVKAAIFPDASGAYGAFTYYRSPEMLVEDIGTAGASLNERVLFYRGNVLIDAVFEKLNAMSASELRELANQLPLPSASGQKLGTILSYVPHGSSERGIAKYVLGPVALQKVNAPLPSDLVDFSTGAEVALAKYGSAGGEGTLMLIYYPTQQVASAHLKAIEAAQEQNTKQPGSVPALNAGSILSKRTGSIVAVAAGPITRNEAQSLLDSVNYEANVTWNERNPFDKKNNIGDIVWNALLLCGILMAISLIAGLAFGGLRVMMKKFFPAKFDREDDAAIISLQLEQSQEGPEGWRKYFN
jgi:hypothetical protein